MPFIRLGVYFYQHLISIAGGLLVKFIAVMGHKLLAFRLRTAFFEAFLLDYFQRPLAAVFRNGEKEKS